MNKNAKDSYNTFQRWSVVTVFFVYALIGIGGIVRSTGAGMGCPDWPKCFGKWVPPTDEKELPSDYQEIYRIKREEKNAKLNAFLESIGVVGITRKQALNEENGYEDNFNATKTWIEYLNRLFGVIVGILVFGVAVLSTTYWKRDRVITGMGLLSLVLIGIQGWVGSLVVSTNLSVGMVTFHMFMAIAIVFVLLYTLRRSKGSDFNYDEKDSVQIRNLQYVFLAGLAALLVQIYLGTQVRESVDVVSRRYNGGMREKWIEGLNSVFYVHRSFSIVILVMDLLVVRFIGNLRQNDVILKFWWKALFGLTLLEILTGMGMAYFGIPKVLQPIHLTVAIILAGVQYWIITYLKKADVRIPVF